MWLPEILLPEILLPEILLPAAKSKMLEAESAESAQAVQRWGWRRKQSCAEIVESCSLPLARLPSSVGMGTAPVSVGITAGVGGIDAFGDGEAMGLAVGSTLLRVLKSSSTNSLETRFGAFGSSLLFPVFVVALLVGLSATPGGSSRTSSWQASHFNYARWVHHCVAQSCAGQQKQQHRTQPQGS